MSDSSSLVIPELTIWTSPTAAEQALSAAGYYSDAMTAQVVYLARALGKPILIEGPSGVGKTSLAKCVALALGVPLVRLQCYEGLDESKALYDWNYRKQLLAMANAEFETRDDSGERGVFNEEFLVSRPLLRAISAGEETVLLIDEVDRIEMRTEALLLEVLSEYQVSIPELGTIVATHRPMVFVTSNGCRELSEALRRRCLSLFLAYPDVDREQAIIMRELPGIRQHLAADIAAFVARVRHLHLDAPPSIADTLVWAKTLVQLSVDVLGEQVVSDTLYKLLRRPNDVDHVLDEVSSRAVDRT